MFDKPTMRIIPSASVVRVHLFRHGEVAGSRVCRGQSDARLSPRGEAQSAAAAEWLRRAYPAPDVVITSDLSRCTTLARHLSPTPILVPALREQDMGRWDGRGWEDLTIDDPAGTTAYWDDYVNARPPGGESYGECFARATTWWDAQEFADQRVVVVTHIGVIRALACHWLGLGPDQALRWAPSYASHSRVLLADAGAVIESFGETAYLP
ncbi:MAG: histidine phosphatase family protein [Myxococcota bacterium]